MTLRARFIHPQALESPRLLGLQAEPTSHKSLMSRLPMAVLGALLALRGVNEVFPLPISGTELASVLSAGWIVYETLYRRGNRAFQGPNGIDVVLIYAPLVIGLLFAGGWAVTHSLEPQDFRIFMNILQVTVIVTALCFCRNGNRQFLHERTGAFAAGIIGMTFLTLLLSKVLPFVGSYAFEGSDLRFRGFFEHPNQMAMVVTAMLPLIILSPKNKWYKISMSAVVFYLILLSGSKTNILFALVFPYIMLLIFSAQRKPLAFFVLLGMGFALIINFELIIQVYATLSNFINPEYSRNLLNFINNPQDTQTYNDRALIWHIAYKAGLAHPMTGVGWRSILPMTGYSHAHNVWLNYFMAYGLAGLGLVFFLHILLFRAGFLLIPKRVSFYRPSKESIALWAGAVSLLASTYFSDSMSPVSLMVFMVIIALLFGNLRMDSQMARTRRQFAASLVRGGMGEH